MNRVLRLSFYLAAALLCAAARQSVAAAPAPDWQIVKIGKWDYLTVDNIAKFYGFSADVTPIGKTIRLDNGKNQLEVTLDSREAIVNGVRNWLCFPVLQGADGKFLVSRVDLAKSVEPQFRPHMIKNLGRIKTVVIDPGHGGVERGATSSYGNEKDFTLDVALKLRPLLQAKGFNVVMTRDKDELVPLHERARIANATRDSIFISIHFNATDYNSSATGFEIYSLTPRGAPSTQDVSLEERFGNMQVGSPVDAPSAVLSMSVYHSMVGHMPEFDRGIKRARFAVLRLTGIPAILVEGGFLTERDESKLIARPEWRAKLAESIAAGIDSYRGLVDRKERPLLLADYRRQLEGVLVARNASSSNELFDTPSIFPASNHFAPGAQLTQPIHHEPSEEISIPPALAAAMANTAPSASPALEGSEEDVAASASPEEQVADAVAENASAEMPDPQESATPPAAESSASPAPVQIRKYWVLKLPIVPKFRE